MSCIIDVSYFIYIFIYYYDHESYALASAKHYDTVCYDFYTRTVHTISRAISYH